MAFLSNRRIRASQVAPFGPQGSINRNFIWTPMTRRTAAVLKAKLADSPSLARAANEPGILWLLFLAAWCGLLAGLLEVGTIVLRKHVVDPDRLYKLSRHFGWLIPLSNLGVFLVLGLLGCLFIVVWRRQGRWIFSRALCALTILPSILVAFPRIYALAWLALALGAATRLVPLIEQKGRTLRRVVWASLPAMVAIVAILAAAIGMGDWSRQKREASRPLPPSGSPNVLLIVLDTVAAGHLGILGYHRPTSTTLTELAERGINFESARAGSSWTLPSHATMFTGRWLHELSVGWLTPLDQERPTLAEFLSERGYATAGFVANTFYCGHSSGLDRGFTRYNDFYFPELTALKTCVLVSRALAGFQTIIYFIEDWLEDAGLLPFVERAWQAVDTDRKAAAEVNRELLGWLSDRTQPERPFFAFLNYFDAHYPYQLPSGRLHRFGTEPTDQYQRILIQHWWDIDKTTLSPDGIAFAVDAYDDCIADLDEQIGKLVDEARRARGIEEHLADHRGGPRRKLRRTSPHLRSRVEPLRHRAPCSPPFHSTGRPHTKKDSQRAG